MQEYSGVRARSSAAAMTSSFKFQHKTQQHSWSALTHASYSLQPQDWGNPGVPSSSPVPYPLQAAVAGWQAPAQGTHHGWAHVRPGEGEERQHDAKLGLQLLCDDTGGGGGCARGRLCRRGGRAKACRGAAGHRGQAQQEDRLQPLGGGVTEGLPDAMDEPVSNGQQGNGDGLHTGLGRQKGEHHGQTLGGACVEGVRGARGEGCVWRVAVCVCVKKEDAEGGEGVEGCV